RRGGVSCRVSAGAEQARPGLARADLPDQGGVRPLNRIPDFAGDAPRVPLQAALAARRVRSQPSPEVIRGGPLPEQPEHALPLPPSPHGPAHPPRPQPSRGSRKAVMRPRSGAAHASAALSRPNQPTVHPPTTLL